MSAVLTIARREIYSFFVSPIAYVVLTVWLLFFGMMFFLLATFFASQPMGGGGNLFMAFFGGTSLFYLPLLLFPPVLTMRLLAEERSSGTLEALMTAPVTEWSIVLGKYLAAMVFWVTLWLPTLVFVWIGSGDGEIDWGATGAAYVGILGIGTFYMAVGLFMSAAARNQIVAATLTFMVFAGMFMLGLGSYATNDDSWRAVFEYVGMWTQMSSFSKGIVDTRFLIYDASIAVLAIFLSVRVLQANRWQ